jgi:cytochrome P450
MDDGLLLAGDSSVSFTEPAVQQCPFPVYERLQAQARVYLDPITGHYILTRYADVRRAVLNQKQLSSDNGIVSDRHSPVQDEVNAIYLQSGYIPAPAISNYDPPQHRLHRAPLDRAFDHFNVKGLEEGIIALADSLIDTFINDGHVEFVGAFAAKLPMYVIAAQLGVDVARMDDFKRWSDARVAIINPDLDPVQEVAHARTITEMYSYFIVQIARVRKYPDETLLTKLVQVKDEAGNPLVIPELLSLMESLLVAGNETTAFALATTMKLLVDDPALVRTLRDHPEKIDNFVEESLRARSPLQTHFRRTKEEVDLHGVTIPKGAIVEIRYGAANRDAETFECPEKIDIDRPNAKAHLAFGAGIHICIGMQLAKAELRIAVERIVTRLANLRLIGPPDEVVYTPMYISHGVTCLNIAFKKA